MSSDIAQAFAHPEERSIASAPADPRDRISLRDHIVTADIGAFQQERGHGQRLQFNIVVEVRPVTAPLEDDVDRILSYDRITEAVAAELAAERLNLLETLAERVAERILAAPQAMRVFVRIEKLDRGPGALGVEIVRSRASVPVQAEGEAVHPVLAYLSNDVIQAPDLAARLDALEAGAKAVVLVVGLPEATPPQSAQKPTQRRIDLLAIEQNAWVLAGRDARCVVVSSRTELDWAMKHGKTVVWAPSKIVLDAVDGPKGAAHDAVALAVWLAEQLVAERLELHGNIAAPAGSRVKVLTHA
ncbi:dihydroneopterin aldolase [Thioclava sp. GXIMD4216]|uniref:dihydroneopterin aldolase n=1 Tax=Thioclava litoralis TaxID=3076557 RepID=A0ABZ1E193_9RHOB|nr:dihydroneopterin aldolase [Thioclava sp. FTW29]